MNEPDEHDSLSATNRRETSMDRSESGAGSPQESTVMAQHAHSPRWALVMAAVVAISAIVAILFRLIGIGGEGKNFAAGEASSARDTVDSTTETVAPETITVGGGDRSEGMVFADRTAPLLYVVNAAGYTANGGPETAALSIVDLTTRSVTARLPLPSYPRDVAVDSVTHTVYVVTGTFEPTTGGVVTVIDAMAGAITAEIPTGKNSWDVEVDENTHTAYVLNCGRFCTVASAADEISTLSVIPWGAAEADPAVPFGSDVRYFALDAAMNRAYTASGADSLDVIDLATNTVVSSITLPHGASHIHFDQNTRQAVTTQLRWEEILAVDIDKATSTAIDSGSDGNQGCFQYQLPYRRAFDGAGHTLYSSCPDKGGVIAYDTVTGAMTDTIQVADASGIAFDPTTNTLFVYGGKEGVVTIIARPPVK